LGEFTHTHTHTHIIVTVKVSCLYVRELTIESYAVKQLACESLVGMSKLSYM
jgi:hypothetical protein